jgi:hypothetical protein
MLLNLYPVRSNYFQSLYLKTDMREAISRSAVLLILFKISKLKLTYRLICELASPINMCKGFGGWKNQRRLRGHRHLVWVSDTDGDESMNIETKVFPKRWNNSPTLGGVLFQSIS